MNAIELTKALKGRWHGRGGMACCPAHRDTTPRSLLVWAPMARRS